MGDGRCGDGRLASGAHYITVPSAMCGGRKEQQRAGVGLGDADDDFLFDFRFFSAKLSFVLSYLSFCSRFFCWICRMWFLVCFFFS